MASTARTTVDDTNMLGRVTADARYELLDAELSPADVPNFRARHTHEGANGMFVDVEDCIAEMRQWLDDRINAGEPRAPHRNADYQSISSRTNIRHYTYGKAPRLPHPETMDSDGASCIEVSLKGTVEPGTRYKDPEPKTEAYQCLWNVVVTFATATRAEVRLSWSPQPRDDLSAYLFYDL